MDLDRQAIEAAYSAMSKLHVEVRLLRQELLAKERQLDEATEAYVKLDRAMRDRLFIKEG